MNPHFGNRAAFAILGEDPSKAQEVFEAVKAFVVNGKLKLLIICANYLSEVSPKIRRAVTP
jgi:hypothetical protein